MRCSSCFFLSNLFTLGIGSFLHQDTFATSQAVPKPYLFTGIIVFSVIGSYVGYASVFDIYVMLAFAVLGYGLTKFKINLPTVIVAFFLGPMLETKLRQTLKISGKRCDRVFYQTDFAGIFNTDRGCRPLSAQAKKDHNRLMESNLWVQLQNAWHCDPGMPTAIFPCFDCKAIQKLLD